MTATSHQRRRYIIKGTVWCIGSYFLGAIFGSILFQLYGAPPPKSPEGGMSTYARYWCATQLAGLKAEVENRLLEQLDAFETGPRVQARWQTWHATWQTRLNTSADYCIGAQAPVFSDAFGALRTLGGVYAGLLNTSAVAPAALRQQLETFIAAEMR